MNFFFFFFKVIIFITINMSDPKRMCCKVDLIKIIGINIMLISFWTNLLISIRKIHYRLTSNTSLIVKNQCDSDAVF